MRYLLLLIGGATVVAIAFGYIGLSLTRVSGSMTGKLTVLSLVPGLRTEPAVVLRGQTTSRWERISGPFQQAIEIM
jgi:hypothetical protein